MTARPSGGGHDLWLVSIQFSDSVTGFAITDISVTDGSLANFNQINKVRYTVNLRPPAHFDSAIRVSIAENVAFNSANEGNRSQSTAFFADTKGPVLESAHVVADQVTLGFDEDFDRSVIPDVDDFGVRVGGAARDVTRLLLGRDEVTLILESPVRHRDIVALDYTPGQRPLSDDLGNSVRPLAGYPVENRTSQNAGAPSPPRSLFADAAGSASIELGWTAPADSGSAGIGGYQIEWSEDSGRTWRILLSQSGASLTSYTHTGLSALTTYHYRVRATNSFGLSDPSNVASASTTGRVPGRPASLTARASGSTRIDLVWTAATQGAGGPVTGYRIEVSPNGASDWRDLVRDTRSLATTYSDTGLEPGTTRHYRVSAINREGTGSPSAVARATTGTTVPGAPTNLRATAAGQGRINLSWSAPTRLGGLALTGYTIQVSQDGGATWTPLATHTGSLATTYSHTGLSAGATRHYRVAAINSRGTSAFSAPASATTAASAPHRPTSLQAVAQGPSSIRLSWGPPLASGGAAVTGYRIEVSANGGLSWGVLVANTGSLATTYLHSGLNPVSTHHYRVAAINRLGTGSFSATAHATTAAEVPGAPRNLEATAAGHARIDLEWDPPASDGGARITGYRIEVSASGRTGPWRRLGDVSGANSTSYSHRGLSPRTTRHYRVTAVNGVGRGPASAVAWARTEADFPGAPTGLRASADGTSRIDLVWTAPIHTGGVPIIGYRVEVSDDAGSSWRDLVARTRTTATSYTHTGLPAGATRHYRVSAINQVGTGNASAVARATTESTVPGSPASLSATADGTSRIDLVWTAPADDGGARILGYRVEVSADEGLSWTDLVSNSRSRNTTWAHRGLEPGSTRHYRVSAINSVGVGDPSTVVGATTDATVPDAPTNLVATASDPTRIELAWTAPAYDGGAPISGYRIEVSEDGALWRNLVAHTGVTATIYSHGDLTPGSTRFYRVSATNSAGTGMASNVASATTDDSRERNGRVNRRILSHAAAAITSSTVSAIASRVDAVASLDEYGTRVDLGGASALAGGPARGMLAGSRMTGPHGTGFGRLGWLVDGASFVVPVGSREARQQEGIMTTLSVWGSGDYVSLGEPGADELDWSGDLTNVRVGADVRVRPDIVAGLVATSSRGSFEFSDNTGPSAVEGTYDSRLTSVNPYAAWLFGPPGSVAWASGGYGWGEIEIDDEFTELRSAGTTMMSGAVGGGRTVLTSGIGGVRVKGEGWLTRVSVSEAAGVDSLTLDMQRLRLLLEWSQRYRSAGGDEIAFLVEGGMRYDGGGGARGTGFEMGSGMRFVSAALGLRFEGRGRLLVSGAEGYGEWGIGGMVQFDPAIRGQGLSVRLAPAWGETAGGAQELWERGVAGMQGGVEHLGGRFDAEVAYGFAGFGGTPYGGFLMGDRGSRAFSSGLRYEVGPGMGLRLEATRRERSFGSPEHTVGVRGRLLF